MGRISLFSLHRQVRQTKRRILFSLVCSRGSGADLFKKKRHAKILQSYNSVDIYYYINVVIQSSCRRFHRYTWNQFDQTIGHRRQRNFIRTTTIQVKVDSRMLFYGCSVDCSFTNCYCFMTQWQWRSEDETMAIG